MINIVGEVVNVFSILLYMVSKFTFFIIIFERNLLL
jgi:hypothetical protein